MDDITLYNSLTRRLESFRPITSGRALVYTCGPTVYNTPHIGNYKAYVFADVLRRALVAHGYEVLQVINLTDVDDKTIRKSRELGIPLAELASRYEQAFYHGREALLLLPAYRYPRATDSVPMMIAIIQALLEKGFAYLSDDGSVYFRVSADRNYGKLVAIDPEKLKENASGRMTADEYDTESIQDFALWKAWDENDGSVFWDSPWGKGRPGWHIECSAMIKEILGDTIDIHTGGVDNMFPHHENEIAQSECATGKPLANYFMHCAHLLVDGKKMAKRDGNFLMLEDLKEKGISPLAYKYFLYGTHYRTPANLTWDALHGAQTALMRMYEKLIMLMEQTPGVPDAAYLAKVKSALASDLNTAEAIAIFAALFDDAELLPEVKLATILEIDNMLGLGFQEYYRQERILPDDIRMLARERDNARAEKDYAKSDELRQAIFDRGYVVIDTKDRSIVAENPLK